MFSIKRFMLIPLFIVVQLLGGCSTDKPSNVMEFSHQDDEMNSAIQKAQDTLGTFVRNLQAPSPDQNDFMIKARFIYDTGKKSYEHIWLSDVTYDGKVFKGKIDNDPVYVKNLKYGDSATVAWHDVSDWFFIEHGKLVGGYTYRVMRQRLSPEERMKLDKNMGAEVDE